MFKKIDGNTPTDGRKVLAAFKHPQAGWIKFIAYARPEGVNAVYYAEPTHWCELPSDPEDM